VGPHRRLHDLPVVHLVERSALAVEALVRVLLLPGLRPGEQLIALCLRVPRHAGVGAGLAPAVPAPRRLVAARALCVTRAA
jgi:hypothetical protein